jgi:DnaK suppressor protein
MALTRQDLDSIKGVLLTRRSVLVDRHERVQHDLARRNDPLVPDSSDQAIQRENDETLQAIDDAAAGELANIERALQRLEQGRYGLCTRCGHEIDQQRLRAVPHAVTCLDCAIN